MKKLVLALAAVTFLAGGAFAAQTNGVVKEYNAESRVITFEDGTSFTIPADVAIPPEVAVGKSVSIDTDENDATIVKTVLVNPM
ncbi:hypothetical protein [Oryzicola mucosus]|uniref:DUF1344 domain-containing protein n=1 Tax=Oryzicola mucosus TaxID=2767425 RepID=A0A8J6U5P7_9HYPH|nr:hypothetical protein [Oryzicola mucosus]MBD0416695.1 hypothetical protein [Oryzicola mucosus]